MITPVLSAVWSSLSALARAPGSRKIFKAKRLPCRVVSVGNIQAGGTGKTPLVALIANEAHHRGLVTAILSRGYKGEWESLGGMIEPRDAMIDPNDCGDEAALLHDLAPHAYIAVGKKRIQAFEKMSEKTGQTFDLVVLDDGFQHWRIQKDLEIISLTSAGRAEKLFRDWTSSLKKADLLVWTKGETRPEAPSEKPMIRVRYQLPAFDPARSTSGREMTGVWLVSGVADPSSVAELCRKAGYPVVRQLSFGDHARYTREQVQTILEDAREAASQVALTGKDWVKWRGLGVDTSSVRILEPRIEFLEGREVWLQKLWGESASSF